MNIKKEIDIAPIIKFTSPYIFKEKGPLKFIIANKNQIKLKKGTQLKFPLLNNKFREWERSYIVLAPANIPGDTSPCANIIHKIPDKPIFSSPNNTKIINAM